MANLIKLMITTQHFKHSFQTNKITDLFEYCYNYNNTTNTNLHTDDTTITSWYSCCKTYRAYHTARRYDSGGGITNPGNRFDYGYTKSDGKFNLDDFVSTIADEDYTLGMRLGDTVTGIRTGIGNFYKTVSPFLNIKRGFEKADFKRLLRKKEEKKKLEKQLLQKQL